MSSRKRKKAREWMQKEVATRQSLVRGASIAAAEQARKDERNKLTRMIPRDGVDDDTVYPNGKLTHARLVVATRAWGPVASLVQPVRQRGSESFQGRPRGDLPPDAGAVRARAAGWNEGRLVGWKLA